MSVKRAPENNAFPIGLVFAVACFGWMYPMFGIWTHYYGDHDLSRHSFVGELGEMMQAYFINCFLFVFVSWAFLAFYPPAKGRSFKNLLPVALCASFFTSAIFCGLEIALKPYITSDFVRNGNIPTAMTILAPPLLLALFLRAFRTARSVEGS